MFGRHGSMRYWIYRNRVKNTRSDFDFDGNLNDGFELGFEFGEDL